MITFNQPVIFHELRIKRRPFNDEWNLPRYRNICLYLDELKITCSGTDLDPEYIAPQYMTWAASSVIAKKATLQWDGGWNTGQINELRLLYNRVGYESVICEETPVLPVNLLRWTVVQPVYTVSLDFNYVSTQSGTDCLFLARNAATIFWRLIFRSNRRRFVMMRGTYV